MSYRSFLQADASHRDWQVALDRCLSHLQGRIAALRMQEQGAEFTLGFCYLTDYYAPAAELILEQLRERLPGVAWVGTVGVGVAAGGREHFDAPALVLMLAPLGRESFRLFSGRQPLRAAAGGFQAHAALVHGEGSTPDIQELIQELSARTTTGYLFGGLSSARNRTLHIAHAVFTGGLSGVAFGPEVGLISRVTQGCQPIGPQRTITAAERNCVLTLDHKPALACVLQDLGVREDLGGEAMVEALSSTLVGLSSGAEDLPHWPGQFGADTLVRHLVGLDPQQQVLAIADEVHSGMRLAFCSRNARAARADLVRIASEIRSEIEGGGSGQAIGALYVSCSGRGGPHFGAPHAELQTLRSALGDVPLAGFFAGGEIARDHLYGYTGVLTVFTGPARP